ncbi:MAG: biotin carboxylase, partial [Salegentibacter mishustinae]|nr:biotin carboxylase [Salegentibacter mishustinae]
MESKKPKASTKKGAANKKKSAIKTGTDRTKIPITEKAHKAKEQGSSAEKSKKATSKSPVKKSPAKPKTLVTSRKLAAQKKPQNTSVAELNGVSDIRRSFHKNEEPLYFISATNFNLLGADEWIKGFKFITYIECFDG